MFFTVLVQFLGKVVVPVLRNDRIWSDSAENRAGSAVAVHRRSSTSLRAAEANPHGPACSENHRDSAVAFGQLVDAPVVQVVLAMPVVDNDRCARFRPAEFRGGAAVAVPSMVVDVAVTCSDKFPAVREVPQTRSSTGCSSAEDGRVCRILRHFSHSVQLDVSAHFSALDGQQLLVVEGSGVAGTPGV